MDWSHAPIHRAEEPGFYFITAGTYLKKPHLLDESRRDAFVELLFSVSSKLGILVQEWVVLTNHYHLMLESTRQSIVSKFIGQVHRAYLARINYIHQNPVHHGIVQRAENYKWSSVRLFQERADAALVKAVRNFRIDRLNVPDDF